MKPDEMDAVFAALSSEARRRILDILKKEPGANVNRVCEFFEFGRVAVMKHLDVLESANLVLSERVGRERHAPHVRDVRCARVRSSEEVEDRELALG